MPKKKKKKNSEAKKEKAQKKKEAEIQQMIDFLEKKWNNKVNYTCLECLKTAYESVKENKNGYVTDDELIESSHNILRHK